MTPPAPPKTKSQLHLTPIIVTCRRHHPPDEQQCKSPATAISCVIRFKSISALADMAGMHGYVIIMDMDRFKITTTNYEYCADCGVHAFNGNARPGYSERHAAQATSIEAIE